MKKTLLLLLSMAFAYMAKAQQPFTETLDHIEPVAEEWQSCKNIRAAWGNSDVRYAWHTMPDAKSLKQKEILTAWRGERVSTQALIYGGVATDSLAPLTLQLSTFKNGRHTLPAEAVKASFVRYVMTDAWATPDGHGAGCGHRPDHTIYPVHHQLSEFTQTHVHRVSDAIQPSHPLSSPSPPAPNPSQHQSLLQ